MVAYWELKSVVIVQRFLLKFRDSLSLKDANIEAEVCFHYSSFHFVSKSYTYRYISSTNMTVSYVKI